MRDAVVPKGIGQCSHHRVLADQVAKMAGPVFTGQHLVGGRIDRRLHAAARSVANVTSAGAPAPARPLGSEEGGTARGGGHCPRDLPQRAHATPAETAVGDPCWRRGRRYAAGGLGRAAARPGGDHRARHGIGASRRWIAGAEPTAVEHGAIADLAARLGATVETAAGPVHALVAELEEGNLHLVGGALPRGTPFASHVGLTKTVGTITLRSEAEDTVMAIGSGENRFLLLVNDAIERAKR